MLSQTLCAVVNANCKIRTPMFGDKKYGMDARVLLFNIVQLVITTFRGLVAYVVDPSEPIRMIHVT